MTLTIAFSTVHNLDIRRWTIAQIEKQKGKAEFIQFYLRNELAITLRAAECYADNYTAWSHRAWLVGHFIFDKKKVQLNT